MPRIKHHKKYKESGRNIKIVSSSSRLPISAYPFWVEVKPCSNIEESYELACTTKKWAILAAEHDFDRWLLECAASRIEVSVYKRLPKKPALFLGGVGDDSIFNPVKKSATERGVPVKAAGRSPRKFGGNIMYRIDEWGDKSVGHQQALNIAEEMRSYGYRARVDTYKDGYSVWLRKR